MQPIISGVPPLHVDAGEHFIQRLVISIAATAGRIRLLPFTVHIPEGQRDKQLSNKLRSELPGILNWALKGCLAWQQLGLVEPSVVKLATTEYVEEQDLIGGFLEDHCETGPGFRAYNGEVYAQFCIWCEATGRRAFTLSRLSNKLAERGFPRFRDKARGRGFEGLRLCRGVVADTNAVPRNQESR